MEQPVKQPGRFEQWVKQVGVSLLTRELGLRPDNRTCVYNWIRRGTRRRRPEDATVAKLIVLSVKYAPADGLGPLTVHDILGPAIEEAIARVVCTIDRREAVHA